jgi:RNA polymerase sigma-70 factor (ECF subfamily)
MNSGRWHRLSGVPITLPEFRIASEPVTAAVPIASSHELERYRRELTAYCYRMLGSGFDAEDAVQETLIKAWRASDRFEGRSSVRSWLYRIATNVCLDMLRGRQRRARPMEMGPSCSPVESSLAAVLPENSWITPIADDRVLPLEADPADLAEARASVRLAFVSALQNLPARQRAALILCEVLRWHAREAAELLDTTVAAVNSSLQRARATMASLSAPYSDSEMSPLEEEKRELLERYARAFENYDIDALVALLHEDAVQSMPPYAMWLQGSQDIVAWMLGPGAGCRQSKVITTRANGCAAFGQYRVDHVNGGHHPWALVVLEINDGLVSEVHAFLEAERLFPGFGLPAHLPA